MTFCKCGKITTGNLKSCVRCRSTSKRARKSLKSIVINTYGGSCACCSEAALEFLEIDHIDNNGSAHRKAENCGTGNKFYTWLRSHNYPSGYQVLCGSCNRAKSNTNKQCPHQTQHRDMLKLLSKLSLTY